MHISKKRLLAACLAVGLLSACAAPQQQPLPTSGMTAAPTVPAATLPPQPDPTQEPAPSSTAAPPAPSAADPRAQAVLAGLIPYYEIVGQPAGPMDLASRMAYYQVPGVSIAVVENGQVVWAQGFGVTRAGGSDPITPDTLFQAASMSKPVSAAGALTLVRDGLLDLDSDVNLALTSWQVPESELTSVEKVTLRRILSHTAGLTVHGFAGYTPDDALPTVLEILDGQPPANSAPVRVAAEPGSGYDYSGGGYVLLQQLLMDVTGQSFPDLMLERVLIPAGMDSAVFAQPLLVEWSGAAASGHRVALDPLPGGSNAYPELAPAGLWATPTDLAHFLIEIDRAERGEPGALLPPGLAAEMLSAGPGGSGLGWVLPGNGAAGMFGHGGSNAGFRGLMFAVHGAQQGAVVMANSDTGMDLIFEIFRAVQSAYGWPDAPQWRAVGREALALPQPAPVIDPALAGDYAAGELRLSISAAPGGLTVQIPADGPVYSLYALGPDEFVSIEGARWVFDASAGTLQMDGWGAAELSARRVE